MSTNLHSVFPGTVNPGTDAARDLAHDPTGRAGVVHISERADAADIEAEVRIIGAHVSALVVNDQITACYRIVLRDRLADDEIRADVRLPEDTRIRSAVAIAEGMLRGLAASIGVDLADYTPKG